MRAHCDPAILDILCMPEAWQGKFVCCSPFHACLGAVKSRDACHSFTHYTLSNPQIRCVAADILWQPSSLPCLGISSTM